jgi:hypothetical protein
MPGKRSAFIAAQTARALEAYSPDVTAVAVSEARHLRERFLADPYRPRYHFCVPEDMGVPGDPNGAFYANGRYHLMYLYNRTGSGFCWGHISSADLVHWRHYPDAIGPGDGSTNLCSDAGCTRLRISPKACLTVNASFKGTTFKTGWPRSVTINSSPSCSTNWK